MTNNSSISDTIQQQPQATDNQHIQDLQPSVVVIEEEPIISLQSQHSLATTTTSDEESEENVSPLPNKTSHRVLSSSVGSIPPAYHPHTFKRAASSGHIFTTTISPLAGLETNTHQPLRDRSMSNPQNHRFHHSSNHHHHHARSPLTGSHGGHLSRQATSVSMFTANMGVRDRAASNATVTSFGSIFSDTRLVHGNHYPKNSKYVKLLRQEERD